MNFLSRDQQIQIIACLTEGQSIRATERITGIHRDTIMRLGERVGRGCAELHDRMVVAFALADGWGLTVAPPSSKDLIKSAAKTEASGSLPSKATVSLTGGTRLTAAAIASS
jgi:hypothetical protein